MNVNKQKQCCFKLFKKNINYKIIISRTPYVIFFVIEFYYASDIFGLFNNQ